MKKTILWQSMLPFFCLLTSTFLLQAQAPQGIPYQAIARNASGVAIASTAVKVRFSIRDSIATGAIKYQETHNPTTSALGLFSVNVGMGTVVSGTFSGINWGKNAKFLQVELNSTGGTTYTDLGTTQMMSVPYALYAGVAGNSAQSNFDLTPSADSVLTLVGISKLPEGNYTVPNNEFWKIVSVTMPESTVSSTIKYYLGYCNYYVDNLYMCYYNKTDLFSVKIGSSKYTETPNISGINVTQVVSACSQCPPFKSDVFLGYSGVALNFNNIKMPLWANSGEQVSVGPLFVI